MRGAGLALTPPCGGGDPGGRGGAGRGRGGRLGQASLFFFLSGVFVGWIVWLQTGGDEAGPGPQIVMSQQAVGQVTQLEVGPRVSVPGLGGNASLLSGIRRPVRGFRVPGPLSRGNPHLEGPGPESCPSPNPGSPAWGASRAWVGGYTSVEVKLWESPEWGAVGKGPSSLV